VIVSTHRKKPRAEESARRWVRWFERIDRFIEALHGLPVVPPAAQVIGVMQEGDKFYVVLNDPSLKEG
jgi:hypothetical protein